MPLPTSVSENEGYKEAFNLLKVTWRPYGVVLDIDDHKTDGSWVDSKNRRILFTNWRSGEPNNYAGLEDRAFMYNTGLWADCPSHFHAVVVCVKPTIDRQYGKFESFVRTCEFYH